jgi:hypothetical protein
MPCLIHIDAQPLASSKMWKHLEADLARVALSTKAWGRRPTRLLAHCGARLDGPGLSSCDRACATHSAGKNGGQIACCFPWAVYRPYLTVGLADVLPPRFVLRTGAISLSAVAGELLARDSVNLNGVKMFPGGVRSSQNTFSCVVTRSALKEVRSRTCPQLSKMTLATR